MREISLDNARSPISRDAPTVSNPPVCSEKNVWAAMSLTAPGDRALPFPVVPPATPPAPLPPPTLGLPPTVPVPAIGATGTMIWSPPLSLYPAGSVPAYQPSPAK